MIVRECTHLTVRAQRVPRAESRTPNSDYAFMTCAEPRSMSVGSRGNRDTMDRRWTRELDRGY